MPSVEQNQTQIISKIQSGIAGVPIKSVKERVEEWCLIPRFLVAAIHFMIADAGNQRNQSTVASDHVFAVISQKRQVDFHGLAVLIGQVAADHREHGILSSGLDIVGYCVSVDA